MGAAGISCSTSEMSAKGKAGMRIDLDKVPLRESDMSAYEIMLSESQERMLVIAKNGKEGRIKEIFEKWDLHCEIIGTVTNEEKLDIKHRGEMKASLAPFYLVLGGGAPVYTRETKAPAYLEEIRKFTNKDIPVPENLAETLVRVFSSHNIVSKKWVYEQYDSMVRTNTVVGPGSDAAVIRIKGTNKALALKTDCNSRYVYLNPRAGGRIAVAESARNIVCSGGVPLAITNCLNFGNPYKPEIYWQFTEAVAGMGEACRAFDTPVTGGNVSFYNESPDAAVYPTPVIGMLGLIEDLNHITTSHFKNEGDFIYILGEDNEELGGSEYVKVVLGKTAGDAPELDTGKEKQLHNATLNLIRAGLINSAHDISEGGIFTALAECCITGERLIGADATISYKTRADLSLLSETQSRIIISVSESNKEKAEELLKRSGIHYSLAGRTGGNRLSINGDLSFDTGNLRAAYYNTIGEVMAHK